MTSRIFGSELLPALKTLSKPIEALIPAAVLAVLLLSTVLDPSQIPGIQLHLGERILLYVVATYIGGLFNIGSGDSIRQAYATLASLTTSTEYVPAFKKLWELGGIYSKATFSTALACYALHSSIPSAPYGVYIIGLALIAAIVFTSSASAKVLYGPLRFGYLQYSDSFLQTYEIFLNWWLGATLLLFLSPSLHSFFFPFIGLTILGVSTTAWFRVYQDYRKKLEQVVSQVAEAASRAALGADFARQYANVARQYERQILEVLAVTRRDVLLADSVNLTDFFDVAVQSWAALERVTDPFSEVTKKADEIIDAAYDVEDLDKPTRGGQNELFNDEDEDEDEDEEDEDVSDNDDNDEEGEGGDDGGLSELGSALVEKAKGVVKTVKQVDSKLRVARRAVLTSRTAKAQLVKARQRVFTNAQDATSTASHLLAGTSSALEDCFRAAQGADNAKGYGEKAVAAANMGEMGDAFNLVNSAKKAADEVDAVKNALKLIRDNARTDLFRALQTLSK